MKYWCSRENPCSTLDSPNFSTFMSRSSGELKKSFSHMPNELSDYKVEEYKNSRRKEENSFKYIVLTCPSIRFIFWTFVLFVCNIKKFVF